MDLAGKATAFLLMDCKVYVLTVANKEVVQQKVLETEFYPWFTVCTRSTLERGRRIRERHLFKQAKWAAGSISAGGTYRSKDGRSWEKQTDEGWRPIGEGQR